MHPILFKIGSFTLYTYGFFVFLGVITGYFVSLNEAKRENIQGKVFSDVIFWTILISFLGARLFYVFVEWENFLDDPFSIIFSRSGFVFYGGLIFGIGAFYFLTKKYKIDFKKAADILAPGSSLGHALGRIGCFFYGCCFGKPTNSFFGVLFPPDSPAGYLRVKVIPIQLIESFFLFLLFFTLFLKRTKKNFDGQLLIFYVFSYSIFRFIIEFFRGDYRGGEFFSLSISQIVSLILIISIFFLYIKSRLKDHHNIQSKY